MVQTKHINDNYIKIWFRFGLFTLMLGSVYQLYNAQIFILVTIDKHKHSSMALYFSFVSEIHTLMQNNKRFKNV